MMQISNYKPEGTPPYDFTGKDLSGENLEKLDLRNAKMKNTILKGTLFKGVLSMQGADLSGAQMGNGTDFSGLDLTGVQFDAKPQFGDNASKPVKLNGATIKFAQLGKQWKCIDLSDAIIKDIPADPGAFTARNANLSGIDLSGKLLDNVHFYGCVLSGAKFTGSTMRDAIFGERCDLTQANFSGAKLAGAVFNKAILTKTNLDGAELTNASFLNARMDGTVFDNTNLVSCIFSQPASFSRDRNNLTSFKKARLKFSTLNKDWSYLDLREAVLEGFSAAVNLDYLQALHSNLSKWDFTACHLDDADFSGATLDSTIFKNAVMNKARLKAVKGTKTNFSGAILNGANFNNNQELNTTTVLKAADFSGARLNNALFIYADLSFYKQPNGISLPSTFNGAEMMNGDFSNANLTSAQLSGGIPMHNTNFTGALLKGANLSGAQMGAFSTLFEVPATEPHYRILLQCLESLDSAGVAQVFRGYGYELAQNTSITAEIAGATWSIVSGAATYQLLKWTSADGKLSFVVSRSVSPARLTNAIMIDAVLNQADLRNVTATSVELYGPTVSLTNAKLQGIVLSNSNLAKVNLKEAILYRAALDRTNLMNVDLTGAKLDGATMNDCNLQGARFTATQLDGITLSGSAVSVDISQTKSAGVFLLSTSDKALLKELENLSEPLVIAKDLAKAGIEALNTGSISSLLSLYKNLDGILSAKASIKLMEKDKSWEITDPVKGAFRVWHGFSARGDMGLFMQPPFPKLSKLLTEKVGVHLRHQVWVSKGAVINSWNIDNDLINPDNRDTGYIKIQVVKENNGSVSFYGTNLRLGRLNDLRQRELIIHSYNSTIFAKSGTGTADCGADGSNSVFGPDTICPNRLKFSTNQLEQKPWVEMLRPPELPK